MSHISTVGKVRCRVCKESLLRKNYKAHLQGQHPCEDSSNLNPAEQQTLAEAFRKQAQKRAASDATEKSSSKTPRPNSQAPEVSGPEPSSESESEIASGSPELESTSQQAGPQAAKHVDDVEEKVDVILTKIEGLEQHIKQLKINSKEHEKENEQSKKAKKTKHGKESGVMMEGELDTEIDKETEVGPLDNVRSIHDIQHEGTFDVRCASEDMIIYCKLCIEDIDKPLLGDSTNGVFKYEKKSGVSFNKDEILPQQFRNLKKHLRRHLLRQTHQRKVAEKEANEAKSAAELLRQYQVGMNIGRTCYLLYKKGRPFEDFEEQLYLQSVNGVDVGHMNHSSEFARSFMPYVAKTVKEQVNAFIETPLQQTGHRPLLNIQADKATYKHRTRQFATATTIVPDSYQLLQVVFIGQPVVVKHEGIEIAKNWKHELDARKVDGSQIVGASVDGQYLHLSVKERLEELYRLPHGAITFGWDPMHRSGLVDSHLMKEGGYKWLSEDIEVCLEVYRLHNWGQNYEKLLAAAADLEQKLYSLTKTSDTRFANSKRYVFINFITDIKMILSCLDKEHQDSRKDGATTKERKKGSDAAALKGKIHNMKFMLRLSGEADIYNQYGIIINILQSVNLLPHERLAKFQSAVQRMAKMAECINHETCGESCYWPYYHQALVSLSEKSEIHEVIVIDAHSSRASVGANTTRAQTTQEAVNNDTDVKTMVKTQLESLVQDLSDRLQEEVFREDEKELMDICEVLCNIYGGSTASITGRRTN